MTKNGLLRRPKVSEIISSAPAILESHLASQHTSGLRLLF